jgi:hypothetical protein
MDYSKDQIAYLISIADRLHYYMPLSATTSSHNVPAKKNPHPWARFETSVNSKLDLLDAIKKLSYREKFILIATLYEGEEGRHIFSDWADITPEIMGIARDEVLNKMFRLMNPDIENRGGARLNAGRKRKSKIKKKVLIS